MGYCSWHSLSHGGNTCPRCDADRRHKGELEAIQESNYRRANPGEYECPHCKYTSLRRDASRCPLCRGAIVSTYWERLRAVELADAPRRRAAAAAVAEKAARDAAAEARREALSVYFSYFLPLLTYYTAVVIHGTKSFKWTWTHALPLVPVLNWLLLFVIVFSSERALILWTCGAWAIVGVVMFFASWLRHIK